MRIAMQSVGLGCTLLSILYLYLPVQLLSLFRFLPVVGSLETGISALIGLFGMGSFAYLVYLGEQGNEGNDGNEGNRGIIQRGFTEMWGTLGRWAAIVKNPAFWKTVLPLTKERVMYFFSLLARVAKYLYSLVFGASVDQ